MENSLSVMFHNLNGCAPEIRIFTEFVDSPEYLLSRTDKNDLIVKSINLNTAIYEHQIFCFIQ